METERLAATVAAQFNATLDGSKPAFLETVPGLTASFAKDLPPGVHFAEAGGLECIYHEAAVAKELGLPKGADVDAIVRQKLEAGTYGRLLGYGMDTMLERPCRRVSIQRNGEEKYEVKLTVKEFKERTKGTPHVLYCVQTRLIK